MRDLRLAAPALRPRRGEGQEMRRGDLGRELQLASDGGRQRAIHRRRIFTSKQVIEGQIAVGHREHPFSREFPIGVEHLYSIVIAREQIEDDGPRNIYDLLHLSKVNPLPPLLAHNVIGLDSTRRIRPTNNLASGLSIINREFARADLWVVDARHCVRSFATK